MSDSNGEYQLKDDDTSNDNKFVEDNESIGQHYPNQMQLMLYDIQPKSNGQQPEFDGQNPESHGQQHECNVQQSQAIIGKRKWTQQVMATKSSRQVVIQWIIEVFQIWEERNLCNSYKAIRTTL